MSAPMLIAPEGWQIQVMENFLTQESVIRFWNVKLDRVYEYGVPLRHMDGVTEGALYRDIQAWIWKKSGQTPPTPNPEWAIAPSPTTERWKTPAAQAALAKALDHPPPAKEPTLPPGITRHIELE